MLKHGGQWHEVDWARALDYVAHALSDVTGKGDANALATIASPQATLEELYLAQKLTRGLGGHIDSRLRTRDFSLDGKCAGIPWLGMRIAELDTLDRIFVVGSNLRKEQPLLAQRLRVRARAGAQVSWLHAAADDQRLKLHARITVRPSELMGQLAQVVKSAAEQKALAVPAEVAAVSVTDEARKIAASLISGSHSAIFLGEHAMQHTQAASLHALAQQLAAITGARFGYSGGGANAVGAHVAGAVVRQATDANARELFATPRQAYVLLHAEPELDTLYGAQALTALQAAATVVVLSPFKSTAAMEYADVLLPVAPFTETSGSYINLEGRVQSFQAVVKPLGETRPAWKVLRVLGNLTEQPGFDYNSSEEVRREVLAGDVDFVPGLDNQASGLAVQLGGTAAQFERLTEVPLYAVDGLVRRAPALQQTPDAKAAAVAALNAATLAKLGVQAGEQIRLTQGAGQVSLPAALDDSLPDDCVRVAAGYPATAALDSLTDQIRVERA